MITTCWNKIRKIKFNCKSLRSMIYFQSIQNLKSHFILVSLPRMTQQEGTMVYKQIIIALNSLSMSSNPANLQNRMCPADGRTSATYAVLTYCMSGGKHGVILATYENTQGSE